jgi:hypothetical protein
MTDLPQARSPRDGAGRVRIESYYQRRGYFSAEVTAAPRSSDREGGRGHLPGQGGRADPGPDLVDRRPAKDLTDAEPLDQAERPLKVGSVFRHDRYEELKTWLAAWLANRGYPHAVVNGQVAVDRDARTAAVQIEVDVGPLASFGDTEIKGLRSVPRSAIENRLAFDKGTASTLSPRADPGPLYQLNLFSAVRLDYEREGRPPRPASRSRSPRPSATSGGWAAAWRSRAASTPASSASRCAAAATT